MGSGFGFLSLRVKCSGGMRLDPCSIFLHFAPVWVSGFVLKGFESFGIWGLGLGFRVEDFGFGVLKSGFKIWNHASDSLLDHSALSPR